MTVPDRPPPPAPATTDLAAALIAESEDYCWASPRGWGDDVPDRPRCNRPRGHGGNHVMHVVWAPDTDLAENELAFDAAAHRAAADRMLSGDTTP